jgi:hypothetical protein
MATAISIWLLIVLFLSLITCYFLNRSQRNAVLRWLGSGGVPPDYLRLITPSSGKQPLSRPLASSTSDIATTFPPLQRDELKRIIPNLSPACKQALGDLPFSQEEFERSLLRLDEDYRTAGDAKYVFSGFSVREVKALGDFPDYAAISGVPLPKPYPEFDIGKARARPYRPWRWLYHQTMGMYSQISLPDHPPLTFFYTP